MVNYCPALFAESEANTAEQPNRGQSHAKQVFRFRIFLYGKTCFARARLLKHPILMVSKTRYSPLSPPLLTLTL